LSLPLGMLLNAMRRREIRSANFGVFFWKLCQYSRLDASGEKGYGLFKPEGKRAKHYYTYWDNLNKLQQSLEPKTYYEHWLPIVKDGEHVNWFLLKYPD
jgi:hypothetical protein